jgi:hypothetical protein
MGLHDLPGIARWYVRLVTGVGLAVLLTVGTVGGVS